MSFVYETTSYRSWTTVHVFICTPDGEVDVPVMELDGHVADSMSKIPANCDAFILCISGDLGHVEKLAGVVLDSWKKEKSGLGSVLVDDGENMLCWYERTVLRRWLDENH